MLTQLEHSTKFTLVILEDEDKLAYSACDYPNVFFCHVILMLVATANRSAITLGDEDDLRSDIVTLVDVDNIRVTCHHDTWPHHQCGPGY